jgi:hypothetical protein
METREWNIESFGKKFGILRITHDPRQREIILTLEINPSSDIEVRATSAGTRGAQFTFKEK